MSEKSRARRKAFVRAYIANGGNARAAAEAAGLSPATAKQSGSRMLAHPDVKLALAAHLKDAAEDASTAALVRRLARIAHSQPATEPTYRDVNQAARTLLQVNGALQGTTSSSGLTVQIGFLQAPPSAHTAALATSQPRAQAAIETEVVDMGSPSLANPADPQH